ncbi:MAG TPA: glucose 1-dehydrogenase [Stellaceae bacterium]|jgi:NAD(P)-dependent dehydrogenase (short-subunit alcohol dehydrogenase family)|nr:glucose 1-dehydrogenase [Stellaceae bacterium]
MGKLDGKVAIVTGAASGIGPSYAQGLAVEGAKVMVADVEPGDATVRAITSAGGVAQSRICDVSDAAQVTALIRETEKAFGGAHILVNNAAVFARFVAVPLDQISMEDWERAFAVNVRGTYLCVRAALPIMRGQGYGKIINIASGTVFKGVPMMLHYVSTKGAIIAMTRSMASELGGDGIRVNAIAPGLTSTEYLKGRNDIPGVLDNMAKTRAIARQEDPQDLVGACVFLASADSDFVTGQTLVVDGGQVKH